MIRLYNVSKHKEIKMSGEITTAEKWRLWVFGNSGIVVPLIAISLGWFGINKIEAIKHREAMRAEFDRVKIQELIKTISMIEEFSFDNQEVREKHAWSEQFFKSMKDDEQRYNELALVNAEFNKVRKQTQKLRMIIPDKELSEDITIYLHKHALYAALNASYVSQGEASMEERSKKLDPHYKALEESRQKMMQHVRRLLER